MSRWKLALIIVVVLVLAVLGWRLMRGGDAPGGGPGRGFGMGGPAGPIPVTVVTAETLDVPIYLNALGTVQALNTVTVTPQVGGQLKALHFKEGQAIAKGDLIAEIDPRSYQAALDQALARQRQNAAQLSASRSTLQRYEELGRQQFVSGQDLENQRQTVRQQEAMLAADAAAVAEARVQVGHTRIHAPIDGIAGLRQVDVGNLVQANGTPLVVLTQVNPINVMFTLPAQELESVRAAQAAAPLVVDALDRTGNHLLAGDGELRVIDNQIDASSGTFRLKAEFPNAGQELWPGQFVNVRMRVRTAKDALVVPTQAVLRGPEGEYVYKVAEDNTVHMQAVTTAGEAGDTRMMVADGLEAGDRVVTEGQFRLKPGAEVRPYAPGEVPADEPPPAPEGGEGRSGRGGRR